jgi:hypothetical protein
MSGFQWEQATQTFIKLTGTEKQAVWINLANLIAVQGYPEIGGSRLTLFTGDAPLTVFVTEEPDTVMQRLKKA